MSRIVENLYMIVTWVVMVAGAFLVLEDLWRAMGLISAYVLWRTIGNEYQRELHNAHLKELIEHAEPNEKKGE